MNNNNNQDNNDDIASTSKAVNALASTAQRTTTPTMNLMKKSNAMSDGIIESKNQKNTNVPTINNVESDNKNVIHLIVMVHGWLGNEMELDYLETALDQQWNHYHHHRDTQNHCSTSSSKLEILKPKCNVGKTSDGIVAGGTRLAQEIKNKINSILKEEKENCIVTLSIVGNSLGGLYSRFALSLLSDDIQQKNGVLPLFMITTCTPHLGCAMEMGNSYMSLSFANRFADMVVGNVLQDTGRDLFLRSSIIYEMATQEKYIKPLAMFCHRWALANAQWDFQVPVTTGAFLSPSSRTLYTTLQLPPKAPTLNNNNEDDSTLTGDDDNRRHAYQLVVKTKQSNEQIVYYENENQQQQEKQPQIKNNIMAENLNALGWTKIFVNVTKDMPSWLPFWKANTKKQDEEDVSRTKSSWTSNELYQRFTTTKTSRFSRIPVGHTMAIANSRNEWYAKVNANGRPIMQQLAFDMVQQFDAFSVTSNKDKSSY